MIKRGGLLGFKGTHNNHFESRGETMKRLYAGQMIAVLFTLILSISCNDSITIDYPTNNQSFFDTIPDRYVISYKNTPPENIMLNGVNVKEHFACQDGQAIADGEILSGFLKQGENFLSTYSMWNSAKIKFYLDNEGPHVIVTSVTGEESVTITGEVKDPAGTASLLVNGVSAVIDGEDRFTVTIPKADAFCFEAYDMDNRQSLTDYASRKHVVDDIVKVRIDETGINDLLPICQEVIEDMDLNAILSQSGMSTLFREEIGISLPKVVLVPRVCILEVCTPEVSAGPIDINLLSLEVSLVDIDIQELDITYLDLASGDTLLLGPWEGLTVDATITGTQFGLKIDSYVLGLSDIASSILNFLGLNQVLDALDGDFTARLYLPKLRFNADLGLTADNGKVDVTIADIQAIGVGDFNTDFSLDVDLPDAFNLFGFDLAQKVLNVITGGLTASKDFLIEVVLGNIVPAIADPIVDAIVQKIEMFIGVGINTGAQMSVLMNVQKIDIEENDTVMLLGLDGRVGTEVTTLDVGEIWTAADMGSPKVVWVDDHIFPDQHEIPADLGPAPGVSPQALGFLFTSDLVPDPTLNDDELGLMVSRNLINQSLLAIYESGLLNISIPMNDDVEVSVEIDGEAVTQTSTTIYRVAAVPTSAPEVAFKGTSRVIPHLLLNHFEIYFQQQSQSSPGVWEDIFTIDLSADLAVALDVVNNELSVQLLAPDMEIDFEIPSLALQLGFNTQYYINKIMTTLLIEQINMGLATVRLPLMGDLEYGGEVVEVILSDIYVTENPQAHIGINANFN